MHAGVSIGRFAVLAIVVLASGCRALLYHPTDLAADARARLAAEPGWREAELSRGDLALHGLVRPARSADAPWLLFFGGNATRLDASQRWLERVRGGEDLGLAVVAYRGSDGSGGRPTQRALVEDGAAAARLLESELGVRPERLAIAGHSLGAAVAAHVAMKLQEEGRTPGALVLLAPFRSVPRTAREHVWCAVPCLFPDAWRTERIASRFRLPVLVLHGTDDGVIPLSHGKAIAEGIPGARFVEVPGRGHDDVLTPDAAAIVREFVRAPSR